MTPSAVLVVTAAGGAMMLAVSLRRAVPRRPGVARRTPAERRRRVRHRVAGTIGVGVALATVVGTLPTFAAAGAAAITIRLRRLATARRQARAVAAALPHAMELLVLMIHAGASPTQAVLGAPSHLPEVLRPAFAAVEHRLRRGQRLADAIGALTDVAGTGATGIVDAIAGAERYGLPLAPVLDRLADDARAARRRAAEAEARTLPVRLSFPLVTCTLPSFVLLAIVPAVLGTISSLRGHAP